MLLYNTLKINTPLPIKPTIKQISWHSEITAAHKNSVWEVVCYTGENLQYKKKIIQN